jgi:hypothetical protein
MTAGVKQVVQANKTGRLMKMQGASLTMAPLFSFPKQHNDGQDAAYQKLQIDSRITSRGQQASHTGRVLDKYRMGWQSLCKDSSTPAVSKSQECVSPTVPQQALSAWRGGQGARVLEVGPAPASTLRSTTSVQQNRPSLPISSSYVSHVSLSGASSALTIAPQDSCEQAVHHAAPQPHQE